MAKRQSTLFNYFSSPKQTCKKEQPMKKDVPKTEDDDEVIVSFSKKRNRQIIEDSSDSENEKPPAHKKLHLSDNESETGNFALNKSNPIISKMGDSDVQNGESKKNMKYFSFKKEIQNLPNPIEFTCTTITSEIKDIHSNWLHITLDFLQPNRIMDSNKRKPNHPNYDSKTLFVPESYLNSVTPAMRQWWVLKSQHFDSILFFKVGKFYELYHMDAVTGVTQLGLSYMKGDFAHSGFPESAYGKMANLLIDKGYKVARVEQTETPEMLAERCKNTKLLTKFDKVTNREICQITSKATCIYTPQMPEWSNELPYYLYALCMKEFSSDKIQIGVCFVETSISVFRLSEFEDDKHFSRLLSLFAEYSPTLILIEKGGLNKPLNNLLNSHFKDIKKEFLIPNTQFLTASNTLETLLSECYFRNKEGQFHWPLFFKTIANDCVAKPNCELTTRCLGACMWYLKNSKLDIQTLSLQKFEWYDPLEYAMNKKKQQDYLVLDAITIDNLELLGTTGSLKQVLDHCETAFGKRLLVRWICRPLCNSLKIEERQNAIKYLVDNSSLLNNTRMVLKGMPDLERFLMKIHTYGNKFLSTNHPDSRAVLYENNTYSRNKIKDFLKTLKAFETSYEIINLFQGCENRLLRKLTQLEPNGVYPDIMETISYFTNAFDHQQAEKDGKIIPKTGVIDEYDEIEVIIENLKKKLDNYLNEQSKFFGCNVTYVGTDKKRYQLEVPEIKSNKATDEYRLEGAKKGAKPVKRFSTATTRDLLSQMIDAESTKEKVILDLSRKIFEKFNDKRDKFDTVIQCLTILDVLCSLAEYARTYSFEICLPTILPFDDQPKLLIENGRHPVAQNLENYIPNDTKMGVDELPSLLIITGPNMGGKSTLMRQIAIISIMAQIGSFVPASKCELTLIDRIFTRLGAQDDMKNSQSTFYVELSEAASILQYASQHSLLIIDELGRGTSTHDGNAIATSYVNKLIQLKCRTAFSTHYHSLVYNFLDCSDVQLGHMACLIESDPDSTIENVTFLYKLATGRCSKSYGFNAARLAGLERQVIIDAMKVAKTLEEQSYLQNVIQAVMTSENLSEIRQILKSLLIINE
ncbi:probable DNA mismatch repair protein Msh6 isoform X1 [Diorhabda sublineata]|uniref:probable DNA mismatch repair protein Msh6 isoform X1 n=1 Tax=Diorhabda sublineata TaxID=1163346 RepID=UPI0024E135D7|nr:probable DNA mismatch repair protein Msh6 isoform X1 [Diorhabda sublineata]